MPSYKLKQTTQFKKDLKLAKKRNLPLELLEEIVDKLVAGETLPATNKPHILKGNYSGFWECHIKPDWLLIWSQNDEIQLVTLTRNGTHSDLF